MRLQAVTSINNTAKRPMAAEPAADFIPDGYFPPFQPATMPAVGFSICPCKVMMFFSMILIIFYLRKIANK